MKNHLLTFAKPNVQMIARMIIILVASVFFGTSAYSQISGTTPSSRCGEGTLTLHATATSGTIQWYTVPFYGTAVGTGGAFTTPSIFVTTTYYVDAVDGGSCSLNGGQARIPVIATISANAAQAIIFYESNTFCSSVTTPQQITRSGTAGGTFTSSPVGLDLNPSTGAITPSESEIGTYTVTYTVVPAEGCIEEPATTVVSITTAPLTSSIAYTASPYCTTLTSATVTLTNPNSGSFSAEPSGLSINVTTGTVNPSLSLPGAYTVTYFVSSAGGCAPQTTTASLTITGLPAAVVTYPGTPFCKDITIATPALTGTGAYTGGDYSASGLTIDAETGVFNPATSDAGDYTILYTAPASAGCAEVEFTALLTIYPLPTAGIGGTATVCQDASAPLITFTGAAGTAPYTFTYKINDGADRFVTSASGTNPVSVTVSNTTVSPGTFEYTLVSVADAHACAQSASGTATITVSPAQVATFSYQGSPFCKTGTVSPTYSGGGIAGTFTKTSGDGTLSINAETGAIDLAASDAGSYTITNTLSGCGTAVETDDIVILALPTASISGTLTACVTTTLTASTDATNKTYAWFKGEDIINGETGATLAVTETAIYKVKVTNTDTQCEFTSTGASVTINPLPVVSITGSDMACVSTTLTAAHNVSVPSFIWYKDLVSAGTNATLLVTEAGSYTVQVTNTETSCVATSPAVVVTIFTLPAATISAPDPATVCTGAAPVITFAGSTGVEPYTFTYTINSGSDLIVSTVSGNSVTVDVLTTEPGTFIYTLKSVRDASFAGCEKTYSGVTATATVVADPTLSQPGNVSICRGGTTTLTTAASNGTGTYAYQWQYSANGSTGWGNVVNTTPTGITYTGNTSTSLVITGDGSETAAINYYKCVLTTLTPTGAGCNAETTTVAVTSVTDPSWASITAPATSITYGGSVSFVATINDGLGGTITWIRSTTAGAEGITVESPDSPPAAGTYYYRPHFAPTGSGCNLADGTETTVVVGAKQLTVINSVVTTKTYDGNTTAAITGAELSGIVGSDVVTLGNSTAGTFAQTAAGTGISVATAPMTISGINVGNYTLAQPTLTGNIIVKTLTVTATGPTKIYGTALSAGTSTINFTAGATGVGSETVTGVTLTPNAAGLSATTAAGAAYVVTPSLATGTGSFLASNYNITYTAYNGTVSAKALTITATGPTKIYGTALTAGTSTINFTADATGVGSETVTGVTLTPNAAGLSATTAAGAAYVVTPSLATGTGSFLASNYNITYTAYNGTVTAKALTVTATGPTKIYGTALSAGTSTINFTAGATGVGSETVTGVTLTPNAAGLSATTAAGAAYVVTPSLATGTGSFLASNYNITYTAYNGTVTAKALTVTATGPTKIYGTALTAGTSTINFTAGATGVGSETVTGVTLTPNAAGLSATTAAGVAYVVTPSLATGTGSFLASNYNITYTAYNGTVAAKQLTIANPALTTIKTYDGNTTAAVTPGALTGVETIDISNVGVTAAANYNDATVAANKNITVVYTLTGTAASNYIKPVNYSDNNGQINPVAPTGTSPQTFCSGN